MTVEAVVAAKGPVAKPGSVAYRDQIVAVHLIDLADEKGKSLDEQALVYMWCMRNNKWVEAAEWKVGQRGEGEIAASWADVGREHESVRRGEFDDIDWQLNKPWSWGDMVPPSATGP